MDRPKDSSKDVVVFRCIRSDGMQYDEARFPADHKPADEATVRSYCDRLGAMIAEQVYPGSIQSFTLEALPPFYQLRVKTRTDSKTRNDTFLYGYPEHEDEKEKKKTKKQAALKCFRTPSDFFDHLLWLITDATNDGKNCCCRFCKPSSVSKEEAQEATPSSLSQPKSVPVPAHLTSKSRSASPASTTSTRASTKKTSAATSTAKAITGPSAPQIQPSAQPVAKPAIQPVAQSMPHLATQLSAQLQVSAQPTTQPTMQPTMQVQAQTQSDESVLFREGEVIWYRKQGPTFRLGIILQNTPGDSTNTSMSRIKPLAHFQTDLEVVERSDADMRPFLTYSVPKVQEMLQEFAIRPMEEVPWLVIESELLCDENQKAELLILEASKIAASHVDHSYSLFNLFQNYNLPNRLSFGGVFFGCEKIGVFEAVRVSVEQDEHPQWDNMDITFVMVLKSILLERSEQDERLLFEGDIWVLQDSKEAEQTLNQGQIPPAMRREKEFRDGVMKKYGIHYDWVLLRGNVTKTEKFIKGRFYESDKLGPMLYQGQWGDYLRDGYIPSIQKSLNRRLDSWGPTIGRVQTRRDAVAGAIPPGTLLSLGPRVVEQPRAI
ncbi:uncharacterized protein F4807DRAFT_48111 [Annulohypoxylon truncatum]|uniref:uncharacterized protein n=1 Tax=Annulohypoxylon truncatum TaxID=327061 RepID=UPI002007FB10|nr:uncharacterized protein F4807DRAFT_48111 [Annulohypoxylon truncatum]KAI1211038.1 hypothetical protein F4807DRAFT_48111 [Annulohypoxylon truncatum]